MKFLIFAAAVVALFLGVNYLSFSESAISRWVQKSQFPNMKGAELFCSMLTPETQIQFTYSINQKKAQSIPPTAEALCEYYKKRAIPGAERHTHRVSEKIISYEREMKLPYNRGRSTIEMHIEKGGKRKIEVDFKRTLLGDFRIISIKGHDDYQVEIKPRTPRR